MGISVTKRQFVSDPHRKNPQPQSLPKLAEAMGVFCPRIPLDGREGCSLECSRSPAERQKLEDVRRLRVHGL